uniref:Uncharacterized protein n=1 Tax=Aotus nancymaae TaxID=37293 RepID=A0A2K5EPJ8_AOTNA
MPRWSLQQPTSCPHAHTQPLQPPRRTASLGPLVPSWADSGCSRGQKALPAVWPLSCCLQCPQGRPPHPAPHSQRRGSRDLGKEGGEEGAPWPSALLHRHPTPRTPFSASAGCDPPPTQPNPHPTPPQQGCMTPFHRRGAERAGSLPM